VSPVLPLPGEQVTFADAPQPRSAPTNTGQAFFVGETERGPLAPVLCKSFADFQQFLGARLTTSYLSDAAEAFFREGGAALYVSRASASSAVAAFANLADSVPATTLVVTAKGPGTYGNNFRAIVQTNTDDASIPVGSVRIVIQESGVTVETSPVFADKQSILDWAAAAAQTVTITSGVGTGMPVRVASPGTALAGGTSPATADADFQAALDRLVSSLGPGQVAMPGHTTDTRHLQLVNHALANQRHALLDLPNTATVATVTASAQAADAAPNKAGRWASAYWPWAIAPGLTPFSTRIIPWSAIQAGMCAKVDAAGNPNVPVAGVQNGAAQWATGISQDTSVIGDTNRGSLNDNGVNVVMMILGTPTTWGNRTLRTFSEDPTWLQASGSRLAMAIAALGGAIMLGYVHGQIDGKRVMQGHMQSDLGGMLGALFDDGALYGNTPDEAYAVNAGPSINSLANLALGKVKASLSFKASPGADQVTLELVRVALTQGVS
jgi:phage tail sheath protein FI